MTGREPRKIRVIDINDDTTTELLDQHKRSVDYVRLSTVDHVLDLMAKTISAADIHLAADIYLTDVNMQKNHEEDPEQLRNIWGTTDPLNCPYGPILALPFLASSTPAVCLPYSNFFTDPSVTQNGVLLIALSMIFSRTTPSTRCSLQDVVDRITDSKATVNSALTALNNALAKFRNRLCDAHADGEIVLAGIPRTARALRRRAADIAASITDPEREKAWLRLQEDALGEHLFHQGTDGIISINFYDRFAVRHSIRVDSMFADLLGYCEPFAGHLEERDIRELVAKFTAMVSDIVDDLCKWPYKHATEGDQSFQWLEQLQTTFRVPTCLCKTERCKDFPGGHSLRMGHMADSCCQASGVTTEEESARLRYLLQQPVAGPFELARMKAFRELCGTQGVFAVLKAASQESQTSRDEPSVAMVVTMLWMMFPKTGVTIDVDPVPGGIEARLVNVPAEWPASLWGIAQLAWEERTSDQGADDTQVLRLSMDERGLVFSLPNRLSGRYVDIYTKREYSDTVGFLKAVYMMDDDGPNGLPSNGRANRVCVRMEDSLGLQVTWCGAELKKGRDH